MSQTILVTSATGKTGRRLIPLLTRRGVHVRAGTRTPGTGLPGVEPVRFDWTDPSTYEPARKGVDAIYVVTNDQFIPGDAALQVRTLLDGAAEVGVQRVVLLSALGIDSAPAEVPLRRVEVVVQQSAIASTILRPGAFMQNFSEEHWSRLDEAIRERDEVAWVGGDAVVSWVSTQDIAAVAAAALTEDGHEGKAYTVLGPEPLTMHQVVAHISAAAGRHITYVETGIDEIRAGLLAAGTPAEFVGPISEMFVFALTSGAYGILSDDVANVTGRDPISMAEFAAGAAAAWRR